MVPFLYHWLFLKNNMLTVFEKCHICCEFTSRSDILLIIKETSSAAKSLFLAWAYMIVSSAYIWYFTCGGQQRGRPFTYIQNNNGPRTEPCGTKSVTHVKEVLPCRLIHCSLCSWCDSNHCIVEYEPLKRESLFIRILWLTVSNTFLKSRNTAPTTPPLSTSDLTFCSKYKMAVFVEWNFLKPDWVGWSLNELICNTLFSYLGKCPKSIDRGDRKTAVLARSRRHNSASR